MNEHTFLICYLSAAPQTSSQKDSFYLWQSFQLHKHIVTIPELKTDKADYRYVYFWVPGLFIKLMPQSFPLDI